MYCDCQRSVALPRGTRSLSAVYECGIPDHTHLLSGSHKYNVLILILMEHWGINLHFHMINSLRAGVGGYRLLIFFKSQLFTKYAFRNTII